MSAGWIKLHRKILDNAIFKNDKLFRVFMYLLLKASHSGMDQLIGDSIVTLNIGQWATGRKAISRDTGLTEQNVRTAITKLEKLGILTIKATVKYSIFSITNWDVYQQDNQQVTNNQPTSNQQVTTINKVKNEKNVNKDRSSLVNDSFDYWWDFYPSSRRKNKTGCFNKYKAKCSKLSDDEIVELSNAIALDVMKRVKDLGEEIKFMPMTEPYLNQERWMDEK